MQSRVILANYCRGLDNLGVVCRELVVVHTVKGQFLFVLERFV